MTSATVFESIIAPLKPLLTEQAKGLKGDNYTLSFYFFTVNLIYAIVARVTSSRWVWLKVGGMYKISLFTLT